MNMLSIDATHLFLHILGLAETGRYAFCLDVPDTHERGRHHENQSTK